MHRDLIAEIDTDALVGNVAAVAAAAGPGVEVCCVLKSNAYGHEASIVGPVLEQAGATVAAVATIDEAITLRDVGFSGQVLCFGPVFAARNEAERAERLAAIVAYDLTTTAVDRAGVEALAAAAGRAERVVQVHINVDTGMSRLGVHPSTAVRLASEVSGLKNVKLTGLYTHLASADAEDPSHARAQLETFAKAERALRAAGIDPGVCHAANSAALLRFPDARWHMVRTGMLLYGCSPATGLGRLPGLRGVLRLRSHLVLIKRVPTGTHVGYGGTFVTQRESVLGVVPIGYNDGYLRGLSNQAVMGVNDTDAPVVGMVSMDQCVLDLTEVAEPRVGDEVVVIDNRAERPNSLESLATLLGTIPYELACLLGNRIRRVPTGRLREQVDGWQPKTQTPTPDLLRLAEVSRRVQRRARTRLPVSP